MYASSVPGNFPGICLLYTSSTALLECVQTEQRNDDLIKLLQKCFVNRIEVVRGGSVAIEAINMS